jgi:hypothetical protein
VRNVPQQKLLFSQRWKHRRASRPKAVVALAPTTTPIALMPSPPPMPTAPLTAADQARVNKWVRDRLVADWPYGCWFCRRPFIAGQQFIDVRQ